MTRDTDIRRVLIELLVERYPKMRLMEEFGMTTDEVRADIALFSDRLMFGVEIKSDADTLDRLPTQAAAYSALFDRMILACGRTHLDKAVAMVPEWWGIVAAEFHPNGHHVLLQEERAGTVNPLPMSAPAANLLWRDELLAALKQHRCLKGAESFVKEKLVERLRERVSPQEIRDLTCKAIFERDGSPIYKRSKKWDLAAS